jgi:hypothetical protein
MGILNNQGFLFHSMGLLLPKDADCADDRAAGPVLNIKLMV